MTHFLEIKNFFLEYRKSLEEAGLPLGRPGIDCGLSHECLKLSFSLAGQGAACIDILPCFREKTLQFVIVANLQNGKQNVERHLEKCSCDFFTRKFTPSFDKLFSHTAVKKINLLFIPFQGSVGLYCDVAD